VKSSFLHPPFFCGADAVSGGGWRLAVVTIPGGTNDIHVGFNRIKTVVKLKQNIALVHIMKMKTSK